MKIPKSARYDYCCNRATEFLIEENITTLPFDADKILKKHKWAKLKYSQLALKHSATLDDIIDAYDSEDGYSIFNGRNYAISYNDMQTVKQRIYFTKLHEIGHIYLNHFKDFEATILKRSDLTNPEYKVLENEANCFARNVLSPIALVNCLNYNKSDVINAFNITESAANTRLMLKHSDMYWISNEDYILQFNHFKNYIYNATHSYHCSNCQSSFIAESANYCPICGHKPNKIKLHIRSDFDMIYSGYDVNEKGQVKQCPQCENDEIDSNANYCKICGIPVINECTNFACAAPASGNARYCIICGSKTTFYDQHILSDWNTDTLSEEEAACANQPIDSEDIPF